MSRQLFIFLLVLFFLSSCGNNENEKSKQNEKWAWFKDLETGESSWILVGNAPTLKSGSYTLYYYNGSVFETGKIVKGKHVDTAFYFDKTGTPYGYKIMKSDTASVYFYKDGDYTTYYSNGRINGKGNIKNNRIGDQWVSYYKNGMILDSFDLKDGIGLVTVYYENGKEKSILRRNNPLKKVLYLKEWYENGQLSFDGNCSDEQYEGLQRRYYENGTLSKSWEMQKGNLHGFHNIYFENSQLSDSQNYINGKIEGKAFKWYQSGNIKTIANFESGRAQGEQLFFHENGKKLYVINMENNVHHGEWIEYDTTGRVIKKLYFQHGRLIK